VHGTLGLGALVNTLVACGVPPQALFEGTGLAPQSLADPNVRLTHRQKVALFENAYRLSPEPAIGLIAGQRQRISDFGVFGYGVVTSATFGEAIAFGIEHVRIAGPVFEKSFRVEGGLAIFEGHPMFELGPLLPLASEFWFSSIETVISGVLERPFEGHLLQLPYPPPPYASRYEEVMHCPVEFDAPVMQWQFDAALLPLPLPNANPMMAGVCAEFCGRILDSYGGEPALIRSIREACLASPGALPRVEEMAGRLCVSARTLHRRLAEAGTSYQEIIDGIRSRLAVEYLERTEMSVEDIAERSGFSDVSNFRKAFRKWTGQTPAYYRERRRH
jgi:AraC-like DNA-binding protein